VRIKIVFIFLFFSVIATNAQTGIGTTTPDASAKLDVSSTNKGFLPPRVTLTNVTDNTTIANPATGLLVYNTGNNAGLVAGYYYWNGASWATIATASGYAVGSSYLRGSRSAAQTTNLSVNNLVAFSQVDNVSGQEIALNTSTGQITLAAGRTYRLTAQVPNMSGGTRPAFAWYNETTSSWVGSQSSVYSPGDAASYIAFGSVSDAIITANSTTVVSYRIYSGSSLGSIGGNADFGTVGSYPWFDIQVISGNSAVNGQSVDYAIAALSATQSISAVSNVIFNTIQGAGITLNNGGFNLIANKTYKLEGSVGGSSTGYIYYAWVDASNTIISGGSIGSVMKAGGAFTDGPQDKAVAFYTPVINTAVYLRVLSISGTSVAYPVAATPSFSSTWASIQQIGSSAIVNPWVLTGNDVYNVTGEVAIGTTAPNASALLDLTSSNKGLLPPRVALTAKSGTSTPIASPATGLIVYNTASAGTGGDAVTPGYYYFNGTIWTRMDPEGWSAVNTITFGAPAGYTAPTKGTTSFDYVRYRNIGGKEYEVEYNFVQSGAGTAGNGDYLISLPASLQFDFNVPGQTANTGAGGYNAIINKITNSVGDLFYSGGHNSATVVPYDATRFRIHTNNWGSVGWTFYNSSYYQLNNSTSGFKMTFKFKAL
jgi:hypothetical protein